MSKKSPQIVISSYGVSPEMIAQYLRRGDAKRRKGDPELKGIGKLVADSKEKNLIAVDTAKIMNKYGMFLRIGAPKEFTAIFDGYQNGVVSFTGDKNGYWIDISGTPTKRAKEQDDSQDSD